MNHIQLPIPGSNGEIRTTTNPPLFSNPKVVAPNLNRNRRKKEKSSYTKTLIHTDNKQLHTLTWEKNNNVYKVIYVHGVPRFYKISEYTAVQSLLELANRLTY